MNGYCFSLQTGSISGLKWNLQLVVREGSKRFMGYFNFYGKEERAKARLRQKDRDFFTKRLPIEMYNKYEIDHDWLNGGVVTLKTPKEHRNTNKGKTNRRNWIDIEEWL